MKKMHKTSVPFVKRQYMENKDYELFYYNDIKLDTVEQHSHKHYEIYFFMEGSVQYIVDGIRYNLKPGDILMIPPDIVHGADIIRGDTSYCRFVLWIEEGMMNRIASLIEDIRYGMNYVRNSRDYLLHLEYLDFNNLTGHLLDVWLEQNEKRAFKDTLVMNYLVTIMTKINRKIYEDVNESDEQSHRELYALLLDYIDSHITQELTLEGIAEHFFLSKYYVSHTFKDNMGISLHQYIIKKRLNGCRSAIAVGKPINEAAERWGFTDYTVFFRAFKKEYGMSPKEFKERSQLKKK